MRFLKFVRVKKRPTFHDATTGIPSKKRRLRNERRDEVLMTCHYLDLGSASDWLKQFFLIGYSQKHMLLVIINDSFVSRIPCSFLFFLFPLFPFSLFVSLVPPLLVPPCSFVPLVPLCSLVPLVPPCSSCFPFFPLFPLVLVCSLIPSCSPCPPLFPLLPLVLLVPLFPLFVYSLRL